MIFSFILATYNQRQLMVISKDEGDLKVMIILDVFL